MRRSTIYDRANPLFEHSNLPISITKFQELKRVTNRSDLFLTVRVLIGNDLNDPLLRIEIVGEEVDPFLIYLVEISLDSFLQIKEEQQLRVDFDGFSKQVIQLFENCSQQKYRLALSSISGDETTAADSVITLNVFETTTFRELSHLSLKLEKATEIQMKQYLWDRLRQENKRVQQLQSNLKKSEEEQDIKSNKMIEYSTQIETLKLQLSAERNELSTISEKLHVEALKQARLEISIEDQQTKEKQNKKLVEYEMKLKQLEEELDKMKLLKAEAEAEVLRRSGANDALGPLRMEANELRTRCREFETRAFDEAAKAARFQESVTGLQRELEIKEQTISRSSELLQSERERILKFTQETEELKARVKEMEQKNSSSMNEKNSISLQQEQLINQVNIQKQKIQTKNLVIREQEKVVKEQTAEIHRVKTQLIELEQEISLERTKNNELRTKIQELKQRLEESAEMLEKNSSVISYLNRELSSSYGTYDPYLMKSKE